jgi:uncharacterized membrane protein
VRRRLYIDWLRGLSVLVMIEAHVIDSWTRLSDRSSDAWSIAIFVAGLAAPAFLFLAGTGVSMSIGGRLLRGEPVSQAVARAGRRALQVFGLAFLFRLQAFLISGGDPLRVLFKVDVLNVMGLGMLAAVVLWALGRSTVTRAAIFVLATVAVAMATPLRTSSWLSILPGPVEWYVVPVEGRNAFTMLPWTGFLFAGAAFGVLLAAVREPREERRLLGWVAILGPVVAATGYLASWLPPIYADTDFWTSSPTFFFVRLGILMVGVPLASWWCAVRPGPAWLLEFGRSSLFVYWIHVELVYGIVSLPLHGRLPFAATLAGYVAFCGLMYWAVMTKARVLALRMPPGRSASRSAIDPA